MLRLTVGRRAYMNLPGKHRQAPVVRIQGIEAAFPRRSYAPGEQADLRISTDAPRSGSRSSTTRARSFAGARLQDRGHRDDDPGPDRLAGAPERAGALRVVRAGDWPSGLYFLRLTASDGRVGYAPFVVRRRGPPSRVAVVLSTNTWQAYNFWDANGDGWGDTLVRALAHERRRPDAAVPRFRRPLPLPRLGPRLPRLAAQTGKRVDILTRRRPRALRDAAELAPRTTSRLPGSHRVRDGARVRPRRAYRDNGGNLMFLSANNFFRKIVRATAARR